MSRMRWNPDTGEPEVFEDGQDIPEDYLDHHPDDPAYKDAPAPKPKPVPKAPVVVQQEAASDDSSLNRSEIIAALKEGGLAINPNGKKTEALDATLTEALQKALNTAGKEYPEGANSKVLLALVKGTPDDDGSGAG